MREEEGNLSPDRGTPEKVHFQFVNKFKSVRNLARQNYI